MASKTLSTATVNELNAVQNDTERAVPAPKRNNHSAVLTIVLGVALPCIPIIMITSVLLYIILNYRLDISDGLKDLQPPHHHNHSYQHLDSTISFNSHEGGNAAYYVHYNPTTITTIASWTSRVIPYLSSSIMALVAFFAARHIVTQSKSGDEHGSQLPTPEQLSLLINMLGGSGFGPLKDALLYRYRKKEKLMAPLPAAFSALLLIAILAIIIPVLDSWFGIATRSVTVAQLTPTPNNHSYYGRGISYLRCPHGARDNGSKNPNSPGAWWPCNIGVVEGEPAILDLYESSKLLSGVPTTNKIFNYTDPHGVEYLYLGDAKQSATKDFETNTVGLSAYCVPMTQHCYTNFDAAQDGQLFNCTPAFSGNLYNNYLNRSASSNDAIGSLGLDVGLAFAADPQLTNAGGQTFVHLDGWSPSDPTSRQGGSNFSEIYPTNPLHFGAWATGYPATNINWDGTIPPAFVNDTGIVYPPNYDDQAKWVFNCSATAHNIQYTWVNGSVQTFNHTRASGRDLTGLLSAPLAWAQNQAVVQNAVAAAALTAGNSGNNSRVIATAFAREISRTMLAFSLTAMEPKRNLHEQTRELKTVARVPLVPLYLLLATKALYVLAVIVLAIGAYCFTHPAETELVRAQLSVKGLTAAYFDKPGMVQSNAVKELQRRLDYVKSGSGKESGPAQWGSQRSATAPVIGTGHLQEAKVGLLPTIDGGWEFALLANGVWNSIKPVVKSFVEGEATAGKMGELGTVVNEWH